eukprot:TRINITY_DN1210_c0_g2_i2.p1 TRINITY_DN1210_c0_g2~~TRINITY_DN1210_c0_g2_i2.p1  ORF type:complete len:445 (+),score=41.28 TRINITY_DN1210_c0_g2_i2:110-1444(+)
MHVGSILVVLVCCCELCLCVPQIINAAKYTKEFRTFGDHWNAGIIELEFDSDIHFIKGLSKPCSDNCSKISTCPLCNYSDPRVCSGQAETDSCPCFSFECDSTAVVRVPLGEEFNSLQAPRFMWSFDVPPVCKALIQRITLLYGPALVYTVPDLGEPCLRFRFASGTTYDVFCPQEAVGTIQNTLYYYLVKPPIRAVNTLAYQQDITSEGQVPSDCELPPQFPDHICLPLQRYFTDSRPEKGIKNWRFGVPVPEKCFTLSISSDFEVMWISWTEPYLTGLEPLQNNTYLFEPHYYHYAGDWFCPTSNPTMVLSFCPPFPASPINGQHYLWVYARAATAYDPVNIWFNVLNAWQTILSQNDSGPQSVSAEIFNGLVLECLKDGHDGTGGEANYKIIRNAVSASPRYEGVEVGSHLLRVLWPSESPIVFLSPPSFLWQDARYSNTR